MLDSNDKHIETKAIAPPSQKSTEINNILVSKAQAAKIRYSLLNPEDVFKRHLEKDIIEIIGTRKTPLALKYVELASRFLYQLIDMSKYIDDQILILELESSNIKVVIIVNFNIYPIYYILYIFIINCYVT